jgi:hypothetical protein
MTHTKKVNLTLVGLGSNASSLLRAFQRQARKEGWTKDEIDEVINKAKGVNYSYLLATLCDHCNEADPRDVGTPMKKFYWISGAILTVLILVVVALGMKQW